MKMTGNKIMNIVHSWDYVDLKWTKKRGANPKSKSMKRYMTHKTRNFIKNNFNETEC